jgi:hypothetical protein
MEVDSMTVASCSLGTVGIAAIYLIYGAYCDHLRARHRREAVLRQRVAFMLWRVACRFGGARLRGRVE